MNKWYRGKFCKGILTAVNLVAAVMLVVSFLWVMVYPEQIYALSILEPVKERYEETQGFAKKVNEDAYSAMDAIYSSRILESDGNYDPEKVVDIEEFYNRDVIVGENRNGIAYTISELLTMRKEAEDGYWDEVDLVVCRKPDGSYYYYTYDEIRELFYNGDLQFEEGTDGWTIDDILSSWDEGYEVDYLPHITDRSGNVLYEDFWKFDYSPLSEFVLTDATYAPDGYASLLEFLNKNEQWNGRLSDIVKMLNYSMDRISTMVEDYQNTSGVFAEGNTNFSYMLVDIAGQRVYTNRSEYADYNQAEDSIQQMMSSGKYAVIAPKLSDCKSNVQLDADSIREIIAGRAGLKGDYRFVVAVDTTYPIQDDYYKANARYDVYMPQVRRAFILMVAGAMAFIITLIWLTAVAARKPEDEELHLNAFDRVKTELTAVIICTPAILCIMGLCESVNYAYRTVDNWFYLVDESVTDMLLWGACTFGTAVFVLIGYLTLVRRLKARTLWKNSIVYWLLRGIVRGCKKIYENRGCVGKMLLIFGGVWLLHMICVGAPGFLIIALPVDVVLFVFLVQRAAAKQKIADGVKRIADGDAEYKIPMEHMRGDDIQIAERVNHIGEGINKAVAACMKNERLKTDLITNVSHDIKTPLTSIINYVGLLKQEPFDDPKVQRYLDIIDEKSQRLKTLTEDIVEASKISSGNITLEYMNINLTELVYQTTGEFTEKFEARNLKIMLNVPEEPAMIRADGRRIWRVLENIYNNAAKYAMPGTRIYADLSVLVGQVVFSLKNVSEQPLNISAEELTERFIRGDVSRSTEGSGLGLSIAQNLTELQGGTFKLYLDGDLFKVTITFPKVG